MGYTNFQPMTQLATLQFMTLPYCLKVKDSNPDHLRRLNAITLQMVTDRVNIANTQLIAYWLSMVYFKHLTLANSKRQDHVYAYFDCEYLSNCNRQDKHCYCECIGSRLLALDCYIYICPWPMLKVKVIRNSIAKNSIYPSHAAFCHTSDIRCSFLYYL